MTATVLSSATRIDKGSLTKMPMQNKLEASGANRNHGIAFVVDMSLRTFK